MAFSFSSHTGDNTTVTFPFSFTGQDEGYLREDDINVTVDDVEVDFSLTGLNQVTLSSAPSEGADVRILRIMPTNLPYTDFQRGNTFGAANINYSFLQQLYLLHEAMDGFKEDGYYEKQNLSMGSKRITDLAEGIEDTDAVTLGQVIELGVGGEVISGVVSVNGKTGIVSLTQDDISNGISFVQTEENYDTSSKAKVDNISISAPVNLDLLASYNEYTDVAKTKVDFISVTQPVDLDVMEAAIEALEAGGVTSVNGETGTVVLTQDDILDGITHVQTANDYTDADKAKVDFITITQAQDIDDMRADIDALEAGGVTSVNSETGIVVLTQDDILDGVSFVQTANDFSNTYKTTVDLNATHRTTVTGNPHSVTAAEVNALAKDNITVYTPTQDYHPATKKYVDDNIGGGDGLWTDAGTYIRPDNVNVGNFKVNDTSGKLELINGSITAPLITSNKWGFSSDVVEDGNRLSALGGTEDHTGSPNVWLEKIYNSNSSPTGDPTIPVNLYAAHEHTGTGTGFTHSIMGYALNNGTGNNDVIGVSGRARKVGIGVGDAAGVWGSAYNDVNQNGGVMGLEGSIYQNSAGMVAGDRLDAKWSVGLHINGASLGSPAKAGIAVDASNTYRFWNAMIIDKTCFAGAGDAGTVGINMGSCDASNYPQYAIKLGRADSHIHCAVESLNISSANSMFFYKEDADENFVWRKGTYASYTDLAYLNNDGKLFPTSLGFLGTAAAITVASNELTFYDAITGTKTLADLVGGVGSWTDEGTSIYSTDQGTGTNNAITRIHDSGLVELKTDRAGTVATNIHWPGLSPSDPHEGSVVLNAVDFSTTNTRPTLFLEKTFNNTGTSGTWSHPGVIMAQSKLTGSGTHFLHCITAHIENAGTGDNDAVGVASRATKTGNGVGDNAAGFFWGVNTVNNDGACIGLEAMAGEYAAGSVARDSVYTVDGTTVDYRYNTAIHTTARSDTGRVTAGIVIDSDLAGGIYGIWNGILLEGNAYDGAGTAGTTGINMAACGWGNYANNYPQYGIKFGKATKHIYGRSDLSFQANGEMEIIGQTHDFYATGESLIKGYGGNSFLRLYQPSIHVAWLVSEGEVVVEGEDAAISVTGSFSGGTMRVAPTYPAGHQAIDLGAATQSFEKLYCTKIRATDLPTSASGLSSGDLWRNGTVVNVVV